MIEELSIFFSDHPRIKYAAIGSIFSLLVFLDVTFNGGIDPMLGYRDGGPDFIMIVGAIIFFIKAGFNW